MSKFVLIVGVALTMAAIATLGHDVQTWFERGAWSSTTVGNVLEWTQLDNGILDRLRQLQLIHSVLQWPFYLTSICLGFASLAFGLIFDQRRG